MKTRLLALATLLAGLAVSRGQGTSVFEGVTNVAAGSIIGGGNVAAWTFQTTEAIEVTGLGVLSSYIGTYTTMYVALWNMAGQQLASATIVQGTNIINGTYYSSITPIGLSSGIPYAIGMATSTNTPGNMGLSFVLPGDGYAYTSPYIQLGHLLVGTGSSFVLPGGQPNDVIGPNGSMVPGANFLYRNIPEPGAFGLLGGGLALWASWRKRRAPSNCV